MRKLWQISDDLEALAALLDGLEGEITDDEAGRAIEKWFDEIGAERNQKIDNYCALIRQYEAYAAARQFEAGRLEAMAKADENKAENLKQRLHYFFEKHDIAKLETDRFKVAIQNNGGSLPLIYPDTWKESPESAPEKYQRVEVKLNTEAIREDLRNDQAPDGVALGVRGKHLRIR